LYIALYEVLMKTYQFTFFSSHIQGNTKPWNRDAVPGFRMAKQRVFVFIFCMYC